MKLPNYILNDGRAAIRSGDMEQIRTWHAKHYKCSPQFLDYYSAVIGSGDTEGALRLFDATAAQHEVISDRAWIVIISAVAIVLLGVVLLALWTLARWSVS